MWVGEFGGRGGGRRCGVYDFCNCKIYTVVDSTIQEHFNSSTNIMTRLHESVNKLVIFKTMF